MQKYFVGEIIRESLIDPSVLDAFKPFLVKSRTAEVENFDPSIWHIERYSMPLECLKELVPLLQNNIDKNQWYIHFYSTSANEMFVILSGRTFQLPKLRDSSWSEMIRYGEQVGVGRRWTENIPVDFEE